MDWRSAELYLALTTPREEPQAEGIYHIIHRKKPTKGQKPKVRIKIISGPLPHRVKVGTETYTSQTGQEEDLD